MSTYENMSAQNQEFLLAQRQVEQQQQQIDNDPNAVYADTMREDKITNILSQISPDNQLIDIAHRIRGEKKNPHTGEWELINPDQEPVNEEMVANFMSFLGSILNQNTSMSNFSPSEINNIMFMVTEFIQDDLDVNCRKYGIEGNYTEMTRIGMIVLNSVFTVLKRAQNGLEAGRIFKALRVTENLNPNPTNKRGVVDALKFW